MPTKTTLDPPVPANNKSIGIYRSLLYNGSKFVGFQKSKGNSYEVEVSLQVLVLQFSCAFNSNLAVFIILKMTTNSMSTWRTTICVVISRSKDSPKSTSTWRRSSTARLSDPSIRFSLANGTPMKMWVLVHLSSNLTFVF